MAKSSNASPEVFGFDFQVNATIFLLLDNIKDIKTVRMEGASEDIELTMNDGNQIMAQAKGIVKGSSDFSHVRSKLSDAIRTLSSADNSSVEQLILITNSKNPLNEDTSKGFFYGPPVAVSYKNLSDDAKKVMVQTIIGLFEQYNDISSAFEDLTISYDDFYTCAKAKVSEADKKAFITSLSSEKRIPIDFSDNSNDNLLGDVCEWLSQKSETLSNKAEVRLPDIIGYGESISIVGANGQEYTLILDELHGIPDAGSEEAIEVSLKSNRETIARGYVKLTIGYLDFDENGGASDGIEDSIDYEVEDVLEALESLILKLRDELYDEQDLAASIKKCIEKCE